MNVELITPSPSKKAFALLSVKAVIRLVRVLLSESTHNYFYFIICFGAGWNSPPAVKAREPKWADHGVIPEPTV